MTDANDRLLDQESSMLRAVSDLKGHAIEATDGLIGHIFPVLGKLVEVRVTGLE
jgi:hypothetical protein